MGRTVLTYRTVLETLIGDWQGFRKALRKEDAEAFDRLMDKARGLASAAGYDPRLDPMESVVSRSWWNWKERSKSCGRR